MPEAKMRKYCVTLQRRVRGILSTMKIVIEATDRRKAVFIAETSINKSDASCNRITGRGWKTQKVDVVENNAELPKDADTE